MSSKVFSRRSGGGTNRQLESPLKHAEPQFLQEHHQAGNQEQREKPVQLRLNMGSESWEQEELLEEDESPSAMGRSSTDPFRERQQRQQEEAAGSPSKRLKSSQLSPRQGQQPRAARHSLLQAFLRAEQDKPSPGPATSPMQCGSEDTSSPSRPGPDAFEFPSSSPEPSPERCPTQQAPANPSPLKPRKATASLPSSNAKAQGSSHGDTLTASAEGQAKEAEDPYSMELEDDDMPVPLPPRATALQGPKDSANGLSSSKTQQQQHHPGPRPFQQQSMQRRASGGPSETQAVSGGYHESMQPASRDSVPARVAAASGMPFLRQESSQQQGLASALHPKTAGAKVPAGNVSNTAAKLLLPASAATNGSSQPSITTNKSGGSRGGSCSPTKRTAPPRVSAAATAPDAAGAAAATAPAPPSGPVRVRFASDAGGDAGGPSSGRGRGAKVKGRAVGVGQGGVECVPAAAGAAVSMAQGGGAASAGDGHDGVGEAAQGASAQGAKASRSCGGRGSGGKAGKQQQQQQQQVQKKGKQQAPTKERAPAQTIMEAHERGELVQAQDDATYALDGLTPDASLDTQRDSACALLDILATRRGRLALRSEGLAQQVLTGAAKLRGQRDPALALACSGILLALASDDALPAYLSSSAAAVLASQLLQVDHDFSSPDALSAAVATGLQRKVAGGGSGSGGLTADIHSDGSEDEPTAEAATVAAGVSAAQRVMCTILEGSLGRSLRAGAGAAGHPLRSHIPLLALALATATGTEAGRVHHAARTKENLCKVGVLKKLGLLVPSYTARIATFTQQQQQQQQPALRPHSLDQEYSKAQEQQQQQQQQQQQLEGALAELRLVLQVLENCTFTCVENENELLQLKVPSPDAACTLPATDPSSQGPCTSAATTATSTSADGPSFLSALLELVKLLGRVTSSSQSSSLQPHAAILSDPARTAKLDSISSSPTDNRHDAHDLLTAPTHGPGTSYAEAPAVKRGCQECLQAALAVLMNMTHDHADGVNAMAEEGGLQVVAQLVAECCGIQPKQKQLQRKEKQKQQQQQHQQEGWCSKEERRYPGEQEDQQHRQQQQDKDDHPTEDEPQAASAKRSSNGLSAAAAEEGGCLACCVQRSAVLQQLEVLSVCLGLLINMTSLSPDNRGCLRNMRLGLWGPGLTQQQQQLQQQEAPAGQGGPMRESCEWHASGEEAHGIADAAGCEPGRGVDQAGQPTAEVVRLLCAIICAMAESESGSSSGPGEDEGTAGERKSGGGTEKLGNTGVEAAAAAAAAAAAGVAAAPGGSAAAAGAAAAPGGGMAGRLVRAPEAALPPSGSSGGMDACPTGVKTFGRRRNSLGASGEGCSSGHTSGGANSGRRVSRGGTKGRDGAASGSQPSAQQQEHHDQQQQPDQLQHQQQQQQQEDPRAHMISGDGAHKVSGDGARSTEADGSKEDGGAALAVLLDAEGQEGHAEAGNGVGGHLDADDMGAAQAEGTEVTAEALHDEHQEAEASIVQVYASMLLGFVIQDCPSARGLAATLLPGGTLEPLVAAIQRCLAFYVSTGAITDVSRDALLSLLGALAPDVYPGGSPQL